MNCFVCNLPILSHQVGLVWQGGNGVDDLLREQMEMVSTVEDQQVASIVNSSCPFSPETKLRVENCTNLKNFSNFNRVIVDVNLDMPFSPPPTSSLRTRRSKYGCFNAIEIPFKLFKDSKKLCIICCRNPMVLLLSNARFPKASHRLTKIFIPLKHLISDYDLIESFFDANWLSYW